MPASAATTNRHLTNYASGIAQDKQGGSLASFIAPVVSTGIAHGQFKRYSDKNDFQVVDTSRAVGGSRKRIEFGATDPFFNCLPQGLETTIDDYERDLAGESILNLQESKVRNLVGAAILSHEKKVFDIVKGAKAATGGVGVWSNAANDPVSDIDGEIQAIVDATGRMPNRIVFGIGAWRIFRNHAKVIARQPGAAVQGLSGDQAVSMFLNPSMEFRMGILSADTVKIGGAKTAVNVTGAEVFIFFGSDTPDQYDASFAKTFATREAMLDNVREYREERAASDVYFVDWSEDIQVTAAECGRRITLS